MAKYGAFKYGSGTKYGAAADPVILPSLGAEVQWIISIDWIGTGFDGYNEAATLQSVNIKRGREYYTNPGGTGFERMHPGTIEMEFDDTAQRYNPYNVSSAIYPYVLPGRKVEASVKVIATGAIYKLFTGKITDIQPVANSRNVTITAEDGLRLLEDAEFQTDAIYTTTIAGAINRVLDICKWPASWSRNIKTTAQPLQVFEPNEGTGALCHELAEANLGTFFCDVNGRAVFYPVSYDSVTSHSLDEAILLKSILLSQPWETVRNSARVIANRRGKRPPTAIWSLGQCVLFAANESKTFEASFSTSVNVQVPVAGNDYKANTVSDGTGVDVSSAFGCSLSSTTTTSTKITLVNSSGGAAYLLDIRLIGREIVSTTETKRESDATSIASYGSRRFVLDNPWLQDPNYAASYANWIVDNLKTPQKNPVIIIQQRPATQYPIELMDKVVLTSATLGISETFRVGGIEHEWQGYETGQNVITTLYLQKVIYNNSSITPAPYYPGLPEIPDAPSDTIPPWLDPWIPVPNPTPPPGWGDCLTAAPANGPWSIQWDKAQIQTADAEPVIYIYYPCTLRAGSVAAKSYITLRGLFDVVYGTGNHHASDVDNDWWHVDAIDANKNVLVAGTIQTGSEYTQGDTRIITFAPAAAIAVKGFKISFDSSASSNFYASTAVFSDDGYGSIAAPVANILGKPDGIDFQYHIPANLGSCAIACGFGRTFPDGATINLIDYGGIDAGTVFFFVYKSGSIVDTSHATTYTTAVDFDRIDVTFDPQTASTAYCDAVEVVDGMGTHLIKLEKAQIRNVCA